MSKLSEPEARFPAGLSPVDSPSLPSLLKQALATHGFTKKGVDACLGPTGREQLERGELTSLSGALDPTAPLVTLVGLFVAGLAVDAAAATDAFGFAGLQALARSGLVTVGGGRVSTTVSLEPVAGLVIASDARTEASRPDFVMRVAATTVALAGMTIRRPVASTLDIGCGSGFQALLAAAHSRRVTGIDANWRAVAFARFNGELNEISNVRFEERDLFSAWPPHTFDLIVSNPPFVISPGRGHQFRDSGQEGAVISSHLVGVIARTLAPGGTGQFLVNWPVTDDDRSARWLQDWFEASGCDAWILHETTEPVAAYVTKWLGDTDPGLGPGDPRYDEWLQWFCDRDISGVGYGLVTMAKRASGCGSLRIDDAPDDYVFPCGAELADRMARHALLTEPDAALLRRTWRPAASLAIADDADGDRGALVDLRLTRGLCWRHRVEPTTALLLAGCDGECSLAAVIARVAAEAGVDPVGLTGLVLPRLRPLMVDGLLVSMSG